LEEAVDLSSDRLLMNEGSFLTSYGEVIAICVDVYPQCTYLFISVLYIITVCVCMCVLEDVY
jgi:hypothetical protein